MRRIYLDHTAVEDLRPIRDLPHLGEGPNGGLWFRDTPAVARDPELRRLAEIEDGSERTRETLAYLKTLPPWPEPYTPSPPRVREEDGREDDPAIPTVQALLRLQSPAGWRFSPEHGAMVLHVDARPLTEVQAQLARMASERTRKVLATLSGANAPNAPGLRQEVREEAERFAALLGDESRPLSLRSLELWSSLVALGSHLDANEAGRREGRDPLDLLRVETRAALQTLLQIASNLVRSFPEAQALDEGAAGFQRREVTLEMVQDMIDAALRAAFVQAQSAGVLQHVTRIGQGDGAQAQKAGSVSVRGTTNLLRVAAILAAGTTAYVGHGIAQGALGEVGAELTEHYELGQHAIGFIDAIRARVEDFLANLPPDEAAQVRMLLEEAGAALAAPDGWNRISDER